MPKGGIRALDSRAHSGHSSRERQSVQAARACSRHTARACQQQQRRRVHPRATGTHPERAKLEHPELTGVAYWVSILQQLGQALVVRANNGVAAQDHVTCRHCISASVSPRTPYRRSSSVKRRDQNASGRCDVGSFGSLRCERTAPMPQLAAASTSM